MVKNSGIYKITCFGNGKIYIGSSICLRDRISGHKWKLKNKKHHNPILQASYNKYGVELFEFEIIEQCDEELLIPREQYWMDFYSSVNSGFNIIPRADRQGMKDETKKKISDANKGKIKTLATRNLMRQAHKIRDPIWKQRLSQSKKGIKFSQKHKNKLSEAAKKTPRTWLIGRVFSLEHRLNLSLSHKGQKSQNVKKCVCLETNQNFPSLRDAERTFGITKGYLSVCLKKGKTCKGMRFLPIE